MMTYLLLNLLFLVTLVMFLPKKFSRPPRAWWITLAVVGVLTLIFDPLLIFLGMYGYSADKILGLYVFGAPIEDFFYVIYAACVVPLIWNRVGEKYEK